MSAAPADSGTVLGGSSAAGSEGEDRLWRYHDGDFQILEGPSDADDFRMNAIAADSTVVGDYPQ